jgi:F-type H+-transporting ATPase subunit a
MAAEAAHAENRIEAANIVTLLERAFGENPLVRFIHHYETLFFSSLVLIFLLIFVSFATRRREMIPGPLQNFMEWIVEGINSFFGGILGEQGKGYLPYVGSLFLYIFCMNMFGLIPGMKSPTTSLNTTVALAVTVFITVQYTGIRKLGVGGYFYHLMGRPQDLTGYLLVPMMLPLNLILEVFLPPLSLSLRLFGNISGEEGIISVLVILGAGILAHFGLPGGIPLQLPIMFLALLLGTIQALIFSLLASVYILAVLPHDEGHHIVTEKGGSH